MITKSELYEEYFQLWLITTIGHKLQGMAKQYLIVSQLNYSTPNWIYVVLSRVTSLDGLFLLQPIKENYNPQPSTLLRDEWKNLGSSISWGI